jgi:hypothetical protein
MKRKNRLYLIVGRDNSRCYLTDSADMLNRYEHTSFISLKPHFLYHKQAFQTLFEQQTPVSHQI